MENLKKLQTLVVIAKQNGWKDNKEIETILYLDKNYFVYVNSMYEQQKYSLNDLICDFETLRTSFTGALFSYAMKIDGRSNNTIRLEILKKVDSQYKGNSLQNQWVNLPTSGRLDWFVAVFTPLIEYYEINS